LLPEQLAIVRTSFDEATYVELPDQPEGRDGGTVANLAV
jgi:hypothetical protein